MLVRYPCSLPDSDEASFSGGESSTVTPRCLSLRTICSGYGVPNGNRGIITSRRCLGRQALTNQAVIESLLAQEAFFFKVS